MIAHVISNILLAAMVTIAGVGGAFGFWWICAQAWSEIRRGRR